MTELGEIVAIRVAVTGFHPVDRVAQSIATEINDHEAEGWVFVALVGTSHVLMRPPLKVLDDA